MWSSKIVERPSALVQHREVVRDYGFIGNELIVDHAEHGRLLIVDGFGGIDSVRGGAVRWDQGVVVKLLPGDTFDVLDSPFNDTFSVGALALEGMDNERPITCWEGFYVRSIVHGLGFLGD